MVNDAYIENNKTKKQAWLMIPLVLLIIGMIVLFGRHHDSTLPQLNIIESSAQGMLIELPAVTTDKAVNWYPKWTPATAAARQQVLLSLSRYAADYKQLRTLLEVQPEADSTVLEQLSQRIGDALARYNLGRAIPNDNLPADLTLPDNGLLLICAEDDRELALRLLTALMPYLSGKVSVRFDSSVTAQSMRLYLLGTPYFNDQGQATFDDAAISSGVSVMKKIEQIELEGHRSEIIHDVEKLVEKYRAIFGWDVPDIDESATDSLILGEIRHALDAIELKSIT
ncbi:MAG: hypothetical protein QNK31_05730 [Porticoccus sp.]|nr:hypothetical protein [Porticoccus sp.]